MKKVMVLLICLFFGTANLFAQQEGDTEAEFPKWKTTGIISWAYNQTAVSNNWAGKEAFARVWQARLNLTAERDGQKTNWFTSFKEEYGESDTTDEHTVSLDVIEFNTIWTYKIYKYLQPYASFYVLSQNNKFWDPVTYIESVGLNFTVFDNAVNTLKVRVGGALKQVDDSVNGNVRDEGAEGIINYSLLFHQSAKFTSDFRVFETFETGEDLRWENKLFLKTGPWFTTEFGYTVFYDNSRIGSHHWPDDIETMLYVAFGFSFNIFKN